VRFLWTDDDTHSETRNGKRTCVVSSAFEFVSFSRRLTQVLLKEKKKKKSIGTRKSSDRPEVNVSA